MPEVSPVLLVDDEAPVRQAVAQWLGLAGFQLLAHDRVWIGAGSERHMAGLSPVDLAQLTQARTAELS